MIGRAQVTLSVIYTAGYFIMLWLFLRGYIKTPVEWRDQLSVLLGVLTTGEMLILNFWFMRQREKET